MIKKFTKDNIENLVCGDLFFGTGGGLPEDIIPFLINHTTTT